MIYTLYNKNDKAYWNGMKPLPDEIFVIHSQPQQAEFELLSIIAALHGHITAFDMITGSEEGTEKDADINSVLKAFQQYIYPRMPLSMYTSSEKRMKPVSSTKPIVANEI
jgi:hypothetical protein